MPAHRAAICPRIAYMPQGLGKNLYPDLSVRENIEFFGRLFGQSRSEREWRIAELLDSTGLAPFSDRPAKKLSGGMRQKLGLCCCAHPRSGSADPRRADHRRRSALAPPVLGTDRPHALAPPRHERGGRDRLYGRSRAVRLAGGHERRKGAGHRIPGRSQGRNRRGDGRGCVHCAASGTAARRSSQAADTAAPHPRRGARHRRPRPDLPVRRFHRRRPRQLHHRARRDLRLPRLERLRQDHDHEDADRPAAADRRRGALVRTAPRCTAT